jgi:hypothetical protein
VTEVGEGWAFKCSLHQVAFESALSLRIMIKTDKVDLREGVEIHLLECDYELDFPDIMLKLFSVLMICFL